MIDQEAQQHPTSLLRRKGPGSPAVVASSASKSYLQSLMVRASAVPRTAVVVVSRLLIAPGIAIDETLIAKLTNRVLAASKCVLRPLGADGPNAGVSSSACPPPTRSGPLNPHILADFRYAAISKHRRKSI